MGGCSFFIKNSIPHTSVNLDTDLQAVAVRLSLHKTFTICTIYIPPRFNLAQKHIDNLVNQLPAPFLLVGDFNAHNELWGYSSLDNSGYEVEKVLDSPDICLLNDFSATYLHPASGSMTAIDLSLCSTSIFLESKWF